MSYVMDEISIKMKLFCRKHEPCLIHVEAEHAEANVIPDISIGNRPCVGVCAQLRAPERRGKNNGFELRRCLYVCITEVTRKSISAICVIIVEESKKNPLKKVPHYSQHEGKRYLRRE